MVAHHTPATYRRPSIFGAALRGAVAGPLAVLFVLGIIAVVGITVAVLGIVAIAFVLSHLPAPGTLPPS